MLTEQRKAYRRSGGPSRSSWWLVARNDDGPLEVFTLDGGDTLPVFSGEGEAELFLWLREARSTAGRYTRAPPKSWRRCSAGLRSRAGLVALDPSTEIFDGQAAESPGLSREDFLEWIVSRSL